MNATDAFIDSNVIVYLASRDPIRAAIAEDVMAPGGVVTVQVLNETADVTRRKFKMEWSEVRDLLETVRVICRIDPVTVDLHDHAVAIAERFGFRIWDGLIIAAALEAGCTTLFSEDMQNGQTIEGLTIVNPFAGS